jgi:molybdate transport system substrate-binding protein
MKKRFSAVAACVAAVALVGALGLFGCSSASNTANNNTANNTTHEKVELQVFAANSLTKAMAEVQTLYTQSHDWVSFADTQYKSSGELNSLLEAGSYADIEITASKGTMDTAVEKKYVDESTRVDMFKNDLVIVAAENSDITSCTLEDVATGKYTVAVGDDSVPAGNYANQSLSTVGCFVDPDGKSGKDSAGKANGTDAYAGTPLEGKVVTQTSVGNVCKLAQSGEAQVAFVYTSDVYRFGGVKIVGTVAASTHKNIVYPGAICTQSKNAEEAKAFLDWCTTDEEALKVWQKWGFELA